MSKLTHTTANQLTKVYSRLSQSTERLSSGERIRGANDDAAGLAIRELMRSDIQAFRQGMRNTNDAISMLQTTDGALAVIDEKLIRMKELAEQAATGTYDSVQRAMIASEFVAMGSEIERIAKATDFNQIKLLEFEVSVTGLVDPVTGKTYASQVKNASFRNDTGTYDTEITLDSLANIKDGLTSITIDDAHIMTLTTSTGNTIKATILGTSAALAELGSNFEALYREIYGRSDWATNLSSANNETSSANVLHMINGVDIYFDRNLTTGETVTFGDMTSYPDLNTLSYKVSDGDYANASVTASRKDKDLELAVKLDGSTQNFTQTVHFDTDTFNNNALASIQIDFTVTSPSALSKFTLEPGTVLLKTTIMSIRAMRHFLV